MAVCLRPVILFSLSLLSTLWDPAAAQSRCPDRNFSESELEVAGGGENRARALPPNCVIDVSEEEGFDSTVYIARLEFHRVETIFTVLVFIMVVVLAKMGKWLAKCKVSAV